MSVNDKKPWERAWTTQEIIENAGNWNLAGDAGLLKYLEEFSEVSVHVFLCSLNGGYCLFELF